MSDDAFNLDTELAKLMGHHKDPTAFLKRHNLMMEQHHDTATQMPKHDRWLVLKVAAVCALGSVIGGGTVAVIFWTLR